MKYIGDAWSAGAERVGRRFDAVEPPIPERPAARRVGDSRLWRLAPLAAIAAALLGGCGAATWRVAAAPEAKWRRVTFAGSGAPLYSIFIPPDLVRRPREGALTDYASEDISIRFDYGPVYEQPACVAPRCTIHSLIVDGRQGRAFGVDIYNEGSAYTRRRWFLIPAADGASLAIDIACAKGEACERAERTVRSIRFQR